MKCQKLLATTTIVAAIHFSELLNPYIEQPEKFGFVQCAPKVQENTELIIKEIKNHE